MPGGFHARFRFGEAIRYKVGAPTVKNYTNRSNKDVYQDRISSHHKKLKRSNIYVFKVNNRNHVEMNAFTDYIHICMAWYLSKANSAFYPSGVGKWVPGKAKAGMVHSVSGWTRGVRVKQWDPLRTRVIPERLKGMFTTRRYTNPRFYRTGHIYKATQITAKAKKSMHMKTHYSKILWTLLQVTILLKLCLNSSLISFVLSPWDSVGFANSSAALALKLMRARVVADCICDNKRSASYATNLRWLDERSDSYLKTANHVVNSINRSSCETTALVLCCEFDGLLKQPAIRHASWNSILPCARKQMFVKTLNANVQTP